MDILNYSIDWARGEVFSARIVALVGILVLIGAAGFFLWGKTSMARAYVWPLLTSGVFLLVVAVGLYMANKPRITAFEKQYTADQELFVEQELVRTAKSEHDLKLIVYRVLPALAVLAAVVLICVSGPRARAWMIVLIMLLGVLMAIDSNTRARNAEYHAQLEQWQRGV